LIFLDDRRENGDGQGGEQILHWQKSVRKRYCAVDRPRAAAAAR
jgi:hypothetical protein